MGGFKLSNFQLTEVGQTAVLRMVRNNQLLQNEFVRTDISLFLSDVLHLYCSHQYAVE